MRVPALRLRITSRACDGRAWQKAVGPVVGQNYRCASRLRLWTTVARLVFGLLAGLPLLAFAAQPSHCDTGLQSAGTNPLGYRLRGERCEGTYIQEVGATVLRLVSFTQSYETFDPAINRPLILEWTPPADLGVHVRGQSLKNRVYYRMDSDRPARSTSFNWPLDVVAALQLEKNDLGVTAWTIQPVGGVDRTVYVPLRIRQQAQVVKGPYRMTLMPGVEIEELFLSVALIGPKGEAGPSIIDKQPLNMGYYPAGRPIVVPLQAPGAAGVYRISIGATLKQSGASAITLYFVHST